MKHPIAANSKASDNKANFTSMSDSDLIEVYCTTTNRHSREELYRRYAKKIFGKCISMLGDQTIAHDAVQEVFIRIFENIQKFDGKSSFSTWIYSITYNYCIDILRKNKKVRTIEFMPIHDGTVEIDAVIEEQMYEEKNGKMRQIIKTLRERDKDVLLMKYTDKKDIAEMAEIAGVSESAMKMRLHRARGKAKDILEAMGGFNFE